MLEARNPIDRRDERPPPRALLREHFAPCRRQPVVPAAALPGLLDPAPVDPAAPLEPVEQGIERRRAEADDAERASISLPIS
jgi:hypothetical protein